VFSTKVGEVTESSLHAFQIRLDSTFIASVTNYKKRRKRSTWARVRGPRTRFGTHRDSLRDACASLRNDVLKLGCIERKKKKSEEVRGCTALL
jgi:hypothetical protein